MVACVNLPRLYARTNADYMTIAYDTTSTDLPHSRAVQPRPSYLRNPVIPHTTSERLKPQSDRLVTQSLFMMSYIMPVHD